MKNIFHLTIILLLFPNLLLAVELNTLEGEWYGKCRSIVNEAGVVIDESSSLQSSFQFDKTTSLKWKVTKFKDSKCSKIGNSNRFTLNCNTKTTLCAQTKNAISSDGVKWISKKMIDHAGYPNILKMYVVVSKAKESKILKITTTSFEMGDSSSEELTLKK